jgi:hypothetical protein
LVFYVVYGPSADIISAESIEENNENTLCKCTIQCFVEVLLRSFIALSYTEA